MKTEPSILDRILIYQSLIQKLKETTVSEYPVGKFDLNNNGYYVYDVFSYFREKVTPIERTIIDQASVVINIKPKFKNIKSKLAAEIHYDLFRADLINRLEKAIEIYS